MQFEHYLFDMDGTLFDTSEGVINSLVFCLRKYGIEHERQYFRRFIGPPLLWSFSAFCGFDDETARSAMLFYREHYAEHGIFECAPYDGVPDLLRGLKAAGKSLYVATSKPQPFAERILEHFDLARYFAKVCGSDMDERRSDKALIIADALSGIDKGRALMVGDRHYDIAGAKANGIRSCGVCFGFGSREELEEAGADFIVQRAEEIAALA